MEIDNINIKNVKDVDKLDGCEILMVDESTSTAFFRKDDIIFFMMQGGILVPFELDKFLDVASQFANVSLYLTSSETK